MITTSASSMLEVSITQISKIQKSDINESWNLWKDTFLAVADECIPTKIVKGRYNPPWLTGRIKSLLIKKKETLRRRIHPGTNSTALAQKYKNLRRKLRD